MLAVIPPYSDAYIPATLSQDLPMTLTSLYDKEYLNLGFMNLLQKANNIKVSITTEQATAVEMQTRDQANSRVWFRMRAGRITVSKFKSACHTDQANPSKSLIMSICYPEALRFSAIATGWGCRHEHLAQEKYIDMYRGQHEQFELSSILNIPFLEHLQMVVCNAYVADQEFVK